MNVVMTMGLVIAALVFILIGVIEVAVRERKEKLAYKAEAERKSNTIDYLYKHFEELDKINKDKLGELEELEDAESEEDIFAVIGRITDRNNNRVRNNKK